MLGAPSRLPLGIATSAVLAFGALGVLRVLRHRQQKRRRPGRDLPRPTPAQAETEVALRTAAADQPAEWLDAALRTLARTRPRRREPTPSPVALRVGPDELTVTLAEPVPTPPPMWTTTPPGWVWHLDRNVPLARLHDATRGLCAPMPATTTVGHDAAGPLMLDLEACGLVTITGPVDEARGLARSSVLELSTSPLADVLDIVVVQTPGRPPLVPPTPANERVRVLESPHAALTFVAQQAAATAHSLQDAGLPSTFAARTSAAGADPWPPAVVVLDDVPGADERAEFEALTLPGGRGLAVLAVGDWPGAPWTLDVGDSLLDVSRLGLFGLRASIHAQTINEDTASNVADLLGQTLQDSDDPLVAPAAPSVDTDEDEAPGATPATDPGDSPTVIEPPTPSRIEPAAHEIQVRVLGDVDVVGSTRPLQPGEVELVAFLATREHPVEPDVAQTALWPHREPSPKRWWNVLSSTRQALGCAQDGQFHFPLTQRRERLALAPTVGCDLNELRELLRTMEGQDRAASIAALEEGLRFVRGRPFSARRGYDWAHANGTVAHAEAVVSDAAHALASLQLEVGEAKGALEATAMGLLAAPANEILYRDRMLAHHLAGNTAGVEAALRDLCVALEVEDPCDELHPDTLTLYEELTHRRPTDRTSRSVGG